MKNDPPKKTFEQTVLELYQVYAQRHGPEEGAKEFIKYLEKEVVEREKSDPKIAEGFRILLHHMKGALGWLDS